MVGVVRVLFTLALVLYCAGCVATDQFSSRIYAGNVNAQTALDQETLLNIVRASQYQSLTFVGINNITGSQTASATVGLPAIGFGPEALFNVAANGRITRQTRQFNFGPNSVGGGAQGAFLSNPLISSNFQQSMLTPVRSRIVAMMLGAHPRELVLLALLDGVRVKSSRNVWFFKNDPANNGYGGDPRSDACRDLEVVSRSGASHDQAVSRLHLNLDTDCNFSQFMYYLEYGLAAGMTAELGKLSTGSGARTEESESGSSRSTNAANTVGGRAGQICFDPALARPDLKAEALTMRSRCGTVIPDGGRKFRFVGADSEVELVFRSPLGVYAFLGKLLRDGTADQFRLQDEALGDMRYAKLIDIDPQLVACILQNSSAGGLFCDPGTSARNTLVMVNILQQLRNLMIAATDLRTPAGTSLGD